MRFAYSSPGREGQEERGREGGRGEREGGRGGREEGREGRVGGKGGSKEG